MAGAIPYCELQMHLTMYVLQKKRKCKKSHLLLQVSFYSKIASSKILLYTPLQVIYDSPQPFLAPALSHFKPQPAAWQLHPATPAPLPRQQAPPPAFEKLCRAQLKPPLPPAACFELKPCTVQTKFELLAFGCLDLSAHVACRSARV